MVPPRRGGFPDCEPCLTSAITIVFTDLDDDDALRRLTVFIRLWRVLQHHQGAGYGFDILADIANALVLFQPNGTINRGFLRELYAFQRLRDRYALPLTDAEDPPFPGSTGLTRTQLLQLRVPDATDPPTAQKFDWALDALLDAISVYVARETGQPPLPPHVLKLIRDNIDALSALAGFDPATDGLRFTNGWPHLLRFAELLGKIHASPFTVPQLLFLFRAEEQRPGHAPLPLQPDIEAAWRPFDFVDDWPEMSLFALRAKLLAVEVDEAAADNAELGRHLGDSAR